MSVARWWAVLLLALLLPVAQAATPWRTDEGSELRFRATQAGARFEGRFADVDASIVFDERDLAGSRFDVTITLASTDTRDADRDGVLKGPDFFHVGRYPQARFVATKFRRTGTGYVADGELTLRGVTRPVAVGGTRSRPKGRSRIACAKASPRAPSMARISSPRRRGVVAPSLSVTTA